MSHSHSNIHAAARRRTETWALWRWPVAMGVLSVVGLLTGLVYDGWGDWLSWATLAVPVAAMLWFGWMRRGRR